MPDSPSSFLLSETGSEDPEKMLKQFFLESERVELAYRALEDRFKTVQSLIQDSNTRMGGKLAELDFTSRYLEAILNHMSQGILFLDPNGIVTTYNTAAIRLLQIPEKELLFRSISDFFDDRFFGFSLNEVFRSKKSPPPALIFGKHGDETIEMEAEALFVSKNSGSSSFSPAFTGRETSSRSVQGLLILLRDVTEFRRLQESIHHDRRLKELGELAAHLAHEIRNPLGGIKGFAALLRDELSERPDLSQMASQIIAGSDDLNLLVGRILQFARPVRVRPEMRDVVNLIRETGRLIQADSAWNPKIRFELKSSADELRAPIDEPVFKSALLNLFVNACQAMPDGGVLSVDIESNLSVIAIRICDTGCGISQEDLPKLFSPFFTTKETGTGLGLVEVQKMIQAHRGSIDVQSEPGKGTRFTVIIPLKSEG